MRKYRPLCPAALARSSLVLQRLEPPLENTWGSPPHPPGRSRTCTPRKLLNAISRMRGDHQRYGGTVMFSPASRTRSCCARCPGCPRRPRRPGLFALPRLSRYNFASKCVGVLLFPHTPSAPGGSRSSFSGWNRRRKIHGAPRPKPRAGQGPAPRGNCSTQFPVCVETTNVTVER